MKRVQLVLNKRENYQTKKQEKTLNFEYKTLKLADFFSQVPQHGILISDQNQSLSSEVDRTTTLIASKLKYNDSGTIMVSQASSSSACLTTDLTLPANYLDTSTANVDVSCFIIHFGVEIIAEK